MNYYILTCSQQRDSNRGEAKMPRDRAIWRGMGKERGNVADALYGWRATRPFYPHYSHDSQPARRNAQLAELVSFGECGAKRVGGLAK